jgi:HlyD family secretion protein
LPLALLAIAGCAGGVIYLQERARPSTSLLGVVRETEIRIAPEQNGRLASIKVVAGQHVQKGDLLAMLSSPELAASVAESQAAGLQARADRENVYAGVRREEIDISAQNVRVAEANVLLAKQQYTRTATLAEKEFASKRHLDEVADSLSNAEGRFNQLKALDSQNKAGPTKEERAIADAQLGLAAAKTAALEAKFAKTRIIAPIEGTVGLIVATEGEVISPGQAIMTLDVPGEHWFSFTIREDRLKGISVGSLATVVTATGQKLPSRVSELRPLGEFATWRAARAVGDHDLNSFFVRLDPTAASEGVEPGMTVWLEPFAPDTHQ